jgi:hypothetical protein
VLSWVLHVPLQPQQAVYAASISLSCATGMFFLVCVGGHAILSRQTPVNLQFMAGVHGHRGMPSMAILL